MNQRQSSSSSSPISVHSPPSEYPQSVENSSYEPYSSNSSLSSPSSTKYYTPFPSPSTSPTGRAPLAGDQRFDFYLPRNKCLRFFLEWNACVDEAIRNDEDHRVMCSGISAVFRNCIRDF